VTHITIEHVILIPLLFIQIIVFPLAASIMTSNWADYSRDNALRDAADHLASTIQQLYLSVNRNEISAGTVTQASTLPPSIASYPYTAVGSLSSPLDSNSSKILTLSLALQIVGNTATASAVLGSNVLWQKGSIFQSNSANASIIVQKFSNGTLLFSFGGG
jgi:hypothetical protein